MAWVYPRAKKWDMGITINGFLGGLVAITAPCYWVNSFGAVVIGLIGGIIVVLGIDLVEHFRVDDPIGAVAVHGMAGIWGTWAVGLFATGQYGVDGLFWGGGTAQLWAQIWGNAVVGGRRLRRRLRRHVRLQEGQASCESPKKVSWKASTSTSTVLRRTTRKRPTWEQGV